MLRHFAHIHIPKTAGISVKRCLRKLFGNRRVIHFGQRSKTKQFRKMSSEELMKYRCVGGHIQYATLFEKLGPRFFYFTILRDPYELFVSFYSDVCRRPSHPYHDLARNSSHIEFLKIAAEKDLLKPQVSYLSASRSFAEAASLIESKAITVDTLPNFRRLMNLIASKAGKSLIDVPHLNSSSSAPVRDEAKLRETLNELYKDDVELVAFVENLHAQTRFDAGRAGGSN